MADPRRNITGSIWLAHSSAAKLQDGRPVQDVFTRAGQMSLNVPTPMLGGAEGTCLYVPPGEGSTLAASTGGSSATLVPLAPWPQLAEQGFQEESAEAAGEEDEYPAGQTVDDLILQHAGNRILLDSVGRMLIETKQDVLRVQLPSLGVLKVSQKGEDATGRVPLASAVADKLNEIIECLGELVYRVSSIELALAACATEPVEVGLRQAKAQIIAAATPGGAVAPSSTSEDAIASSALLVSSVTVQDQ